MGILAPVEEDPCVQGKIKKATRLGWWRFTGFSFCQQDIFLRTDGSHTGTLPLNKLRNAVEATGN